MKQLLVLLFLSVSLWAADKQPTIELVAGVGGPAVPANDGKQAAKADVADPTWLFQGPDGSLYFDEPSQNRVRGFRIGGPIRLIAGTGEAAVPPLNPGPARDTPLGRIEGGDIDPIANVAFLDAFSHALIAGVDLKTGRVFAAAGGGRRTGPEPGPATDMATSGVGALCIGQPSNPSIGQRGVLFFLDIRLQKIRRLTYDFDPTTRAMKDAIVDAVAGTGRMGLTPGVPALDGQIHLGMTSGCVYAAPLKKLLFALNQDQVVASVDFPAGPAAQPGNLAVVAGVPGRLPTSCREGEGGLATEAAINPNVLAFDAKTSNIYVSSAPRNCVRRFRIGEAITTVAGTGRPEEAGLGGSATKASLAGPRGIVFDPNTDALYIAARGSRRVLRLQNGILDSVAGLGPVGGLLVKPTPARSASLGAIAGGALASDGTILATDGLHATLNRIEPKTNLISVVAGNGIPAPDRSDDVPAVTVSLARPVDVTTDLEGDIYVVEGGSMMIRRIDPNGRIHLFAGAARTGDSDGDNGPASAARLNNPDAITYSPATKAVYFHEDGRFRRIDSHGIITTIAGNGTSNDDSEDGTLAINANLHGSDAYTHLWVDARTLPETVYFTESGRGKIKKFTVGRLLATVAGTEEHGFNGDGIPAKSASLTYPSGIVGDGKGNLYVADGTRVRRIDPSGKITTVAGPNADWKKLGSLQLDSLGRLVVFDEGTNRVFRFQP